MDSPNYSFQEASHFLKIPKPTLRSWFMGRTYPLSDEKNLGVFKPLLKLPDKNHQLLSFNNLIEAYILRSMRAVHHVKISAVRQSIVYAQKEFDITRLLLSKDLLANAGDLFLERYGKLINLTKSGQIAMKEMLITYLQRIEWNNDKMPIRLYPFIETDSKNMIVIDPSVRFGHPMIASKSISTSAIVDRINAGESPEFVADDYGLSIDEVQLAAYYENRLAA